MNQVNIQGSLTMKLVKEFARIGTVAAAAALVPGFPLRLLAAAP